MATEAQVEAIAVSICDYIDRHVEDMVCAKFRAKLEKKAQVSYVPGQFAREVLAFYESKFGEAPSDIDALLKYEAECVDLHTSTIGRAIVAMAKREQDCQDLCGEEHPAEGTA